jgi:phosphonoacetaldehyde hydrolase
MKHLKAVIFDWAGTLVDYGSLAPMGAFVDAFEQFGIEITIDEARGPMGMAKRAHVAALFALPRIAAAWRVKHGRAATEADIDALYEAFVPRNLSSAAKYAALIPDAAATAGRLRALDLRIGSTTGYTREIMAEILPVAAEQGFKPDSLVCTGDTADGRPTPLMMYRVLLDLGIWPTWHAVKVDDTEVGIAEGLHAGSWSVGVAVSGNLFGRSLEETKALQPADYQRARSEAADKLCAAGAHYVIDSVADLVPVIHAIEGRLERGERP